MNLNRFIIPTATGLLIGSVVFDTIYAESIYPDADIKISPHVSRVVARGKTRFFEDKDKFKNTGSSVCEDMSSEKIPDNPDHRLTLTEDMDLQFTINADYKDPVIFILSNKRKFCAIQLHVEEEYEGFHSTIVRAWSADMPNGTYLMWIRNRYRHEQDEINNYELIIEIDEREDE